jgi:hypothetical protein
MRTDAGALWENFIISERKKRNDYDEIYVNSYFWRTQGQQEIDLVEEKDGILHAIEFKWNENKKSKLPATFASAYPKHTFDTITPSNYLEFLL